jgi:asparagine synthase (glutamine-hydrolysing)
MCGIAVICGEKNPEMLHMMMHKMKHRGPDGTGTFLTDDVSVGHVRLAILDRAGGSQPMSTEWSGTCISFNGEVYNFKELRSLLEHRVPFRTNSDTEVVLRLYEEMGSDCVHELDGMFAFALYENGELFLARDRLGIKPLYYGWTRRGNLAFASEVKGLPGCTGIKEFPAGHIFTSREGLTPYCLFPSQEPHAPTVEEATCLLRAHLRQAVQKRLVADAPVGVFLSGGLDSSIVAVLMKEALDELHSFTVGVEGSPDVLAAREVAAFLGTIHHEYVYSPQEMIEVLPEVIYYLESFDMPLVRSAIPNYFAARLAKNTVRVILTGEGSDELFSGYRYLQEYEDPALLHKELRDITAALHNTNLQRADRMSMAHSIEARVPFLDRHVLEFAFALPPHLKQSTESRMEKWLLRKAFEKDLPDRFVWRPKQKFSEGTGSADVMQFAAEASVSTSDFTREAAEAPVQIRTKEELFYYRLYRRHYGNAEAHRLVGRTLHY